MMIGGDPIRIVPPAVSPVSLAELKAQARIDSDDEDALLAGYLRAATEYVEQYTGLALITSTWQQKFSAWPTTKEPNLFLWRRPVQSVTAINFMSGEGSPPGAPLVLDPSVYRAIGVGQDKMRAQVQLAYGQTWPTALNDPEAITVTYVAGFGDSWNSVPELIRHSVSMAASTWFSYREDVITGTAFAELPSGSKALLRNWRPLAVA